MQTQVGECLGWVLSAQMPYFQSAAMEDREVTTVTHKPNNPTVPLLLSLYLWTRQNDFCSSVEHAAQAV